MGVYLKGVSAWKGMSAQGGCLPKGGVCLGRESAQGVSA